MSNVWWNVFWFAVGFISFPIFALFAFVALVFAGRIRMGP